tara:strand:- start:808 stop:984 length:177 start_codon:yes stop_codon:yes gene_type:complete
MKGSPQRELQLKEISKRLKDGMTPKDISEIWPEVFIQEGEGIIRLWEHMVGKKWRYKN